MPPFVSVQTLLFSVPNVHKYTCWNLFEARFFAPMDHAPSTFQNAVKPTAYVLTFHISGAPP